MNTEPTTPDSELERRLGATLHGHLDRVAPTGDLTGPAVARSRRISRNRGLATAAVAAVAALAVATPLAWSSLRGPDTSPVLPAQSSQTSGPARTETGTPTGTGSATTGPAAPSSPTTAPGTPPAATTSPGSSSGQVPLDNGRTPLVTRTLSATAPSGAVPDVAWVVGTELHRTGRTTSLGGSGRPRYAPMPGGGGVVNAATTDAGGEVRLVDADGATVRTVAAVPRGRTADVAVDAAGARFVVLENRPGADGSDATLTTFDRSGRVVARKDGVLDVVQLVGVVGDRVLLVNGDVGRSYVWDLRRNVIDRYTDSGLVAAVHAPTRRAALFTVQPDGASGCVDVLDVSGAPRVLSRSCGPFVPVRFSPDGDRLVGYPLGTDGFAARQSDVLDIATGRVVLRLEGASVMDSGFVDDDTLALGLVHGYGTGTATNDLQACTLDGDCHRFADPVWITGDVEQHYRLVLPD